LMTTGVKVDTSASEAEGQGALPWWSIDDN